MRLEIPTYHSWAIDYAERVSVALRKQELWNQLREAEAASARRPPPRRRRLWLLGAGADFLPRVRARESSW